MVFIDQKTFSELDWHWIRKFRASKCIDTLDIQASGAERKVSENLSLSYRERAAHFSSINTAYCFRELELQGF